MVQFYIYGIVNFFFSFSVSLLIRVSAIFFQQKIVMKLTMGDNKKRAKALQAAVGVNGALLIDGFIRSRGTNFLCFSLHASGFSRSN